jgi:coenzyme Q-binding protein COQ10
MMAKHVTKYPEIHEVFVVGGDAKGSHIVEKYEKILEGTKLTVDADLKLCGMMRIAEFFGKQKIALEFGKVIDELVKIAEKP